MSAYFAGSEDLGGALVFAPVLVAGDSDQAVERGLRTIERLGLRVAGPVRVADAPDRMDQQVALSALWIELDADGGRDLERLLDQVRLDCERSRYGAVVSARSASIDALWPQIGESSVELVIDAEEEGDRAAALARSMAGQRLPERLSDVGGERSAARLRQLSDEVNRIASALARLSATPSQTLVQGTGSGASEEVPEVSAETVRSVIRARRLRSRYFSEELFADPAWDMLLDLLQAEIAQLRVPVSSLCIAAAVPATTALRWLKTMTQHGLFVRRADPHDGRRVFVELSPETGAALRRYFAEVGRPVVI